MRSRHAKWWSAAALMLALGLWVGRCWPAEETRAPEIATTETATSPGAAAAAAERIERAARATPHTRIEGTLHTEDDAPLPNTRVFLAPARAFTTHSRLELACDCIECDDDALVDACPDAARTLIDTFGTSHPEPEDQRETFSETGGRFSFSDLTAGTYALWTEAAPPFAAAFLTGVEVQAGATRTVELLLPAAGELVGSVLDATNGRPLPDARVLVIDPRLGTTYKSSTDPKGRFKITQVASDVAYVVAAELHDYAPAAEAGVTVEEELILELDGAASLSGMVRHRGRPVAGASVEVDGAPGEQITGDDGRFVFREVAAGFNYVYASTEDGLGAVLGVELAPLENRDLVLDLGSVCDVEVVLRDPGGAPPEEAVVYLTEAGKIDSDDEQNSREVYTDEEGIAELSLVPPGRYRIEALDEALGRAVTTVRLCGPEGETTVTLTLGTEGGVAGVVRDEDGAPINEALIVLTSAEDEPGDTRRSALTDESGRYRLAELGAGRFQVYARKGELRPAQTVFTRSASQGDVAVDLVLERGGSIRGKVIDGSGAPLAGWHVIVVPRRGGTPPLRPPTPDTASDGSFTVNALEDGEWQVSAVGNLKGGSSSVVALDRSETAVVRTGATDVVLVAHASEPQDPFAPPKEGHAILRGTVLNADTREPIAGVQVQLGRADAQMARPSPPARTESDAQGRFTFERVAAGPQFVIAQAEGYVFDSLQIHVTEQMAAPGGAEPSPVELLLAPGLKVSGRIHLPESIGFGASIALGVKLREKRRAHCGSIERDGSFWCTVLEPGVYRGRVRIHEHRGYFGELDLIFDLEVPAGGKSDVELTVPSGEGSLAIAVPSRLAPDEHFDSVDVYLMSGDVDVSDQDALRFDPPLGMHRTLHGELAGKEVAFEHLAPGRYTILAKNFFGDVRPATKKLSLSAGGKLRVAVE